MVLHVPAFEDNYIWLICGEAVTTGSRPCIIVDPGDADPVFEALQQHSLTPVAIFCTHRHGDHVGGVDDLAAKYTVEVYGPPAEAIGGITRPVSGGETIELAGFPSFEVLATPGHTAGHISYFGGGALFCGDTLFSSGCGRVFDGTAKQLYQSLQAIAQLPSATRVYCAHEYTLANLRFALAVEPDNNDTREYLKECQEKRQRNMPTLPSQLGQELKINPFLRTAIATVRRSAERHAAKPLAADEAVFVALRQWKDGFRG